MFLLELIFIFVVEELIAGSGIYIRWRCHLIKAKILGRQPLLYKAYFRKVARSSNPSNNMSNWMINYILGLAVIILGASIAVVIIMKVVEVYSDNSYQSFENISKNSSFFLRDTVMC
jgi:hypothetical protein